MVDKAVPCAGRCGDVLLWCGGVVMCVYMYSGRRHLAAVVEIVAVDLRTSSGPAST